MRLSNFSESLLKIGLTGGLIFSKIQPQAEDLFLQKSGFQNLFKLARNDNDCQAFYPLSKLTDGLGNFLFFALLKHHVHCLVNLRNNGVWDFVPYAFQPKGTGIRELGRVYFGVLNWH